MPQVGELRRAFIAPVDVPVARLAVTFHETGPTGVPLKPRQYVGQLSSNCAESPVDAALLGQL
jgi:hypothetical protein